MSALEKMKGNLYLGYRALVAHPLRKLFHPEEGSGIQRFLRNYAPEGNIPLAAEDRAVLQGASRCIHCGLCDAFALALDAVPRTVDPGVSLLPVCYARATPDLPHARAALAALGEDQIRGAEAVCPTRVPLVALAQLLRRKLAQLDAAVEAAGRAPRPFGPPPAAPGSFEPPRSPRPDS